MSWEKVKLGDITDSCLGKMLDSAKNKGDFEPYIANVNVRWGDFELSELSEMRFEEHEQERYGLRYGDLVVCEGGEIGRCAIWKEQVPNMKFQKALHRIRPKDDRLNNFYLYYWFLFEGKRGGLEQYCSGQTTIKHLPAVKLKTIEIPLPPRDIQDKIANILSAYDDMIDNCRKQIALLEEAAQRLYREWFVDLRFPGYESTAIGEDGLPEGWKKGVLSDFGEFKRGKNLIVSEAVKGNVAVIAGGLTPSCFHNEANTAAPVITVSGSGANAGYTIIHSHGVWASDCSYLDKTNCECIYYIYSFLKSNETLLKNQQRGSAQPHVYAKDLNALNIVIPTKGLLSHFETIAKSYFIEIGLLQDSISAYTSARDLLLPKLMSGELKV